jgi:hypothetical protein
MTRDRYRPNDDEARVAGLMARIRRDFSSKEKSNLAAGETDFEWRFFNNYVGALAEIAVSRMLNMCWTGCGMGGGKRLRDVGDCVEVRSITERRKGLLANKCDTEAWPCVLVFVDDETRWCEALGWETFAAVRAHGIGRNLETHQPYYVLPQHRLRPFHDLLPHLIATEALERELA